MNMIAAYLEWSVASAAMPGEMESGDNYLACAMQDGMLFAAVDGLGHGSEAAVASRTAVETLKQHADQPVVTLLTHCHEILRATRGAAMSLAAINTHSATVTWIGVGNVEGLVLRANAKVPNERLLLRSGVVGSHLPTLHAAAVAVDPGDLLVFTTDGVANDFLQGLNMAGNLDATAQQILAKANKGIDDALVLLVRYRGEP